MKKCWFLVLWLMGLFLLGNGTFAQSYTKVLSDDFNRADVTTTAEIGNGWSSTNAKQYQISNNTLKPQASSEWNNLPLVQSDTFMYGKSQAKIDMSTFTTAGQLVALVSAYESITNTYYGAFLYNDNGANGTLALFKITDTPAPNGMGGNKLPNAAIYGSLGQSTFTTLELIVEQDPAGVKLTANLYSGDAGGSPIRTTSYIDTTDTLSAGQRGVNYRSMSQSSAIDDVHIYKKNSALAIFPSSLTNPIKFGDSIVYTILDDEEQTVTFSDNGAGGTFRPSDVVTLHSSNSYVQTVTYTPAKAGDIAIKATSTGLNADYENNIFVSPYSKTIGFIGDSLSVGVKTTNVINSLLGTPTVFAAIGGSRVSDWVNDDSGTNPNVTQHTPIYSNAVGAFNAENVEVVHILLGTNDIGDSVITYKDNLQALVDKLKASGFRHIIISKLLYRSLGGIYAEGYIQSYNTVIDEIVAENAGYVLLGDIQAYDWLKNNWETSNSDGVHLSTTGYTKVSEFWVDAIRANLAYQITPDHQFTWTNGNTHTEGTNWSLIFRVDKYFGEFTDVVKVDGATLAPDKYVASSGSTTIELKADYLNTLATGTHMLTVGFEGGVWVSSGFTVLPAPTTPPITPPAVVPPVAVPTSNGWGGGGSSLKQDNCSTGDFSPSYYDGSCWTSEDLTKTIAQKVNVLRPLIRLIYLTATEEQKTLIHNLIISCSEVNKKEIIKLACQELVENWDF